MFLREFIESFLEKYSDIEIDAIKRDLAVVTEFSFYGISPHENISEQPIYIATAGGPGSAKSTTLETFLRENNLKNQFVYVDPDAVALKNMIYTYRQSLTYFDFAVAESNHTALKSAYDKWRNASNYINHEIMQIAFGNENGLENKYSVAHGSTSTSPHIESLYKKIKNRGYKIKLLLCYCSDEKKQQFIFKRESEQGFVQCDPNDVIEKGKIFPERFDIYFQYADELFFYWNDNLTSSYLPKPCAKCEKKDNLDMNLIIFDEEKWICFYQKYLNEIAELQINSCQIFQNLIQREFISNQNPSPLLLNSILRHSNNSGNRDENNNLPQSDI